METLKQEYGYREKDPNRQTCRSCQQMNSEALINMDYNCVKAHWSDQIKSGLKSILKEKLFCDITLKVGHRTFDCHRNILSCFSSYFLCMFTSGMQESTERVVTLKMLDPNMVDLLLQYMYTDSINITEHNIVGLLKTATYLQMEGFMKYVSHLDIVDDFINNDNCWDLWSLMMTHPDCRFLKISVKAYLIMNYEQLWETKGFVLNLQHNDIMSILKNPSFDVSSEDIILSSIINWVEHDIESRKKDMFDLLKEVRLPLCREKCVLHLKEHFKEVLKEPLLSNLTLAEKYHRNHGGQMYFTTQQTEYRPQSGKEKVLILVTSTESECPSLWYYSMNTKAFRLLSVAPIDIQGLASCTHGESNLYLCGYGQARNLFYQYSVLSNKWESLEPCPGPPFRIYAKMESIKDKIYIFGGKNTDKTNPSVLSSVYVYVITSGYWQEELFCHLEVLVVRMVSGTIGDMIYVIGGHTVENCTEVVGEDVVQCIDTTKKTCAVVGRSELIRNVVRGSSAYSCNADGTIHIVVNDEYDNGFSVIKFDPKSPLMFETVNFIPTVSLGNYCVVQMARRGSHLIICSPALKSSYPGCIGVVLDFDSITRQFQLNHLYDDSSGISDENILSCHILVLAENQLKA